MVNDKILQFQLYYFNCDNYYVFIIEDRFCMNAVHRKKSFRWEFPPVISIIRHRFAIAAEDYNFSRSNFVIEFFFLIIFFLFFLRV